MKLFIFLLVSLFALISCGGGSGGGDASPETTINPSGDSSTVCGVRADASDTTMPVAEVLFPWKMSRVSGDTVTVSGTASDSSGISAVSVNGVAASIDCDAAKNAGANRKSDVVYEWEATITLSKSASDNVVIKVTDGAGNVNDAADQVQLISNVVPTTFVFDPNNNFVIGNTTASGIGRLDLETGQMIDIATHDYGYYGGFALNGNLVYHVGFQYEDLKNIHIYSTDMNTGIVSTVGTFDVGLPENFWAFEQQVAYDPVNAMLYSLVIFFSTNSDNHQYHIFQYDFNTQKFSTLSSSEQSQGEPLASRDMVFNGDELLVFANYFGSGNDGLVSVDLQTGLRTKVSDAANVSGVSLAVDTPSDTAYISGFAGVGKVDLSNGTSNNISPDVDQDFYNFSQIRSTAVDVANEQVLVGDSDLDMIVGVNTTSGVRSPVFDNGIGVGHKMIFAREMVLDEANQRVLVADDGGNAPEALFSVNLNTGERTQISDINQTYNEIITGMDYDVAGGRTLIAFNQKIIEVDMETELVSVFSNEWVGSGEPFQSISGIALDAANNRLLVADFSARAVLAVDLDSGDRTILSQLSTRGAGDELIGATDIALDVEEGIAYIGSQPLGVVFSVDLESGDRAVVLDECLDGNARNLLDINIEGIYNLVFDSKTRTLWIPSGRLLKFDPSSGECISLGSRASESISDLGFTAKGQMLGVSAKQLMLINSATGALATISK